MDSTAANLLSLTPRFEEALQYATRLHASQKRKGTEIPYIAHLLGVTALVLEDGGDEDEAIAALLHDAVEDQGGRATLEEIRRQFGDRVTRIVEGCTDTETIPKPSWRERKEEYLTHIHHAPPDVRRVSAADKLHNARAILADFRREGDCLWERFSEGKEGTLWYYRALVGAFRQSGSSRIVEELDRVVAELERTARAEGESMTGCGVCRAMPTTRGDLPFAEVRRLLDASHINYSLVACTTCEQVYLWQFHEIVDWYSGRGEDDIWERWTPLTAEEVAEVERLFPPGCEAWEHLDVLTELMHRRRRLTKNPEGRLYWSEVPWDAGDLLPPG